MEVQTFFFASKIERKDAILTATMLVNSVFPLNGTFPYYMDLHFVMVLRRASKESEQPIGIRFRLIDADGGNAGLDQSVAGIFPAGHKFLQLVGTLPVIFDCAGDYRLDLISEADSSATVYSYAIEVAPGPFQNQ